MVAGRGYLSGLCPQLLRRQWRRAGRLAGLIVKLDYITSLGVDAIWLSPIHPSPNRDWGYDVADYEGVHPDYGTLTDFTALVEAAHARGLKIILDEVLAHTSDEHAWFTASRDGDAPKRDWYVWAAPKDDGTGPNNWLSVFGGRPGLTSRRGCNITTTNSCASSPS